MTLKYSVILLSAIALLIFISVPDRVEAQAPVRKVFTIPFVDTTPAYDINQLNQQLMDDLRLASRWHGYQNPNNPAALNYQTYGSGIIKLLETPPHRIDTDTFDYAAVYQ